MEEKTCRTCKFNFLGRCRRYPPTLIPGTIGANSVEGLKAVYGESSFPEVKSKDWCGEWKGNK